MTHRGDMSEEGVQFLIGIEDAVLREVMADLIGRMPLRRACPSIDSVP